MKTAGFAPQGNDGGVELWTEGHTVLGFSIHAADGGATTEVEIVHNTGLD